MRVLEKGTANIVERWTTRCPFCDTKVQINKGFEYVQDVNFEYYKNDSYIAKWFCPICKEMIISAGTGRCSENTAMSRNFSYATIENKVLTADEICELEKEMEENSEEIKCI